MPFAPACHWNCLWEQRHIGPRSLKYCQAVERPGVASARTPKVVDAGDVVFLAGLEAVGFRKASETEDADELVSTFGVDAFESVEVADAIE